MKKTAGIILIALAILLGYFGIEGIRNSGESVEVLGIEISAENKQDKTIAYTELAGALVAFVGGIYLIGKREK